MPLAADLEQATGFEISGGLRGHRVSLEAEYHHVAARTLDPLFTGGLYVEGHSTLHEIGVECGFMVMRRTLEVLGAIDAVDATAFNAVTYRPTVGLNWYAAEHNIKFQLMHRTTLNDSGVRGASTYATYLQAQVAF
jgi:hypothetical protein